MTMFVNRLILLAIVAGMCRAEILPSHEPVVGLQTNDTAVIIDAPVDTNGVSRAQLTLMDGSTLFGTLGERELRFDAAMGQTLTLPVELLASLDMDAKKETAEVAFLNGDRLTGRLVPRELEISGLLGTITVPLDLTSLTTAWNTRFIIAPSMYAEGNNVPFAIDDLKIWGVAKTTFDLD
ncbi:MAG: hypothetical protein ACOYD3_10775 [Kiritimatiellia bacterium]|jgi:hypothetical protein